MCETNLRLRRRVISDNQDNMHNEADRIFTIFNCDISKYLRPVITSIELDYALKSIPMTRWWNELHYNQTTTKPMRDSPVHADLSLLS